MITLHGDTEEEDAPILSLIGEFLSRKGLSKTAKLLEESQSVPPSVKNRSLVQIRKEITTALEGVESQDVSSQTSPAVWDRK